MEASEPAPKLESPPILTWRDVLASERQKPYFVALLEFVENERRAGKVIFPVNHNVFNCLHCTPLDRVKVVILGQDPYHGPNQAHGLCFSVLPPTPPPPSLKNIFLELKSDCGIKPAKHGNLESWAKQGVVLLNAVLTVESGKPQSHAGRGWETFTDQVVAAVNQHCKGVVFLLWGSPAQRKGAMIDCAKHHVLRAPHPSPLSAHRGFFGCRHFTQANSILAASGRSSIDWALPEIA